jgi:histidyl-tRNA synthetase
LIGARGLDIGPVDELEQITRIVVDAGFDPESIVIDLGLGRGLRYYTGILFEVYASGSAGLQIAGGGRYDDLAAQLGARSAVPSAGFSIGLERLLASGAIESMEDLTPTVLVLPGDQPSAAFELAGRLRRAGWRASVDPRLRGSGASRRWAARNGFRAVAQADGEGVAVYRCKDGVELHFSSAPAPTEVTGQ